MMSSRGMGAVNPNKMPKGVRKARRDDTDFTEYAGGGQVWDTPNPAKKHKKLSPAKKAAAKASAKAAGRPYPNLIDNMKASRSK